jgi:putative endonuclease
MFTVYVIKSHRGMRYIGYTENLTKRLGQHNAGLSKYTSRDTDWKLIYQESYDTRSQAMQREKWLKSGAGRQFLDSLENDPQPGP